MRSRTLRMDAVSPEKKAVGTSLQADGFYI